MAVLDILDCFNWCFRIWVLLFGQQMVRKLIKYLKEESN